MRVAGGGTWRGTALPCLGRQWRLWLKKRLSPALGVRIVWSPSLQVQGRKSLCPTQWKGNMGCGLWACDRASKAIANCREQRRTPPRSRPVSNQQSSVWGSVESSSSFNVRRPLLKYVVRCGRAAVKVRTECFLAAAAIHAACVLCGGWGGFHPTSAWPHKKGLTCCGTKLARPPSPSSRHAQGMI